MAIPQKRALSDILLLYQEVEAQGEWLTRERLERKAELNRLKIQIETLKRTLERLYPESAEIFATELEGVKLRFDPESS